MIKRKPFSVITINYNNKLGLLDTYYSLMSQKFTSYEWIVIDGESTDGSIDELRYLLQGSDIDVKILSESDNGCYDAMNKGIEIASGEYLVFMNSGDIFFDENTLSEVNNDSENYKFDIIYGDFYESYSSNKILRKAKISAYIYIGMYTNHQSIYIKSDFIKNENIRYKTKYKIAADYDLLSQLHLLKPSYKKMNIPLCYFDMTGASINNAIQGRIEYKEIRENILSIPHIFSSAIYLLQSYRFWLRNKN